MKNLLAFLFALFVLPCVALAQLAPCSASGDTTNTTYTCSSKGTGSFNIQTIGAGGISFLTSSATRLSIGATGGLTNTGTFTSTDDLRLANTKSLTGTIAAGGSYVDMVTLDGTDNTEINAKTGKELQLQVNATDEVVVSGTAVTVGTNSLVFGATNSKIVPGATSVSLRDTADAEDNFKCLDAGTCTVRAGLTLTAGALTIGATNSKILPGATSISLRDTADGQDNFKCLDAGTCTVRAGLTVTSGNVQATAGAVVAGAGLIFPAAIMETGAAIGNSAATSLALAGTKFIHMVTGADETTGAKLPACAAADIGKIHFVMNTVANKFLQLWPDGTDNINALGAGSVYQTAVAGQGRDTTICACQAAGVWYCG